MNIFATPHLVLTKDLPNSHLSLTKNLYLKEQVILALTHCILQKNDDAIFWGYELYYSGFRQELFHIFSQIYYDFFATLCPNYEDTLFEKSFYQKDETNVGKIIQDLMIRPHNWDIYMLQIIVNMFVNTDMEDNLRNIAYSMIENKRKKIVYYKKIELVKIIQKISKEKNLVNDKQDRFYIYMGEDEIQPYKFSEKNKLPNIAKILTNCFWKTQISTKEIEQLQSMNQEEILYQACFSQIWLDRVHQYSGFIDKDKIVFYNEKKKNDFFEKYDVINNKNIQIYNSNDTNNICIQNYLQHGLINICEEELEIINSENINYSVKINIYPLYSKSIFSETKKSVKSV